MEYKLIQWNNSNYEVQITYEQSDELKWREKTLSYFQKDFHLNWFRKWKVPLHIVEKNIDEKYLEFWIYEELVYMSLKKVVDDNKNIKFIWDIYDLNFDKEKKQVTYKIDTYPEIKAIDETYKNIKIEKINIDVTQEEIDNSIQKIFESYSEFKPTDLVKDDCYSRVKVDFTDKQWQILATNNMYVTKEIVNDYIKIKENIIDKKNWDFFEIKFESWIVPENFLLDVKNIDEETKKNMILKFEILEIFKQEIKEINDENVKAIFKWEVESVDQLNQKVKALILEEKYNNSLISKIQKLYEDLSKSFEVKIPKTLLDEEIKHRLDEMKKNFWWDKNFDTYMEKIWDQKKQEFNENINNMSLENIKKYFIFKYLLDENNVQNVDFNKLLDVEQKLYEIYSS